MLSNIRASKSIGKHLTRCFQISNKNLQSCLNRHIFGTGLKWFRPPRLLWLCKGCQWVENNCIASWNKYEMTGLRLANRMSVCMCSHIFSSIGRRPTGSYACICLGISLRIYICIYVSLYRAVSMEKHWPSLPFLELEEHWNMPTCWQTCILVVKSRCPQFTWMLRWTWAESNTF